MIKTMSGTQEVLNSYNAQDWSQSVEKSKNQNHIDLGPDDFSSKVKNKTFGEFLGEAVVKVNELQKEANVAIEELATGKGQGLHETMLAMEKADLAFKSMNQIRLKIIEAYREVMRMQV